MICIFSRSIGAIRLRGVCRWRTSRFDRIRTETRRTRALSNLCRHIRRVPYDWRRRTRTPVSTERRTDEPNVRRLSPSRLHRAASKERIPYSRRRRDRRQPCYTSCKSTCLAAHGLDPNLRRRNIRRERLRDRQRIVKVSHSRQPTAVCARWILPTTTARRCDRRRRTQRVRRAART